MPRKGKRSIITAANEAEIRRYARGYTFSRTVLAEKIQNELKWKVKPPEIEVLERKISHYRNQASDNPQEEPWCVATLSRSPIPPEALPRLLEIFIDKLKSDGVHLTIREAKWIANLSFVIKDTEQLCSYALEYALTEELAEREEVDSYTSTDDIGLYGEMMGKELSLSERELVRLNWKRMTKRKKGEGGGKK